jgi:hypothetical protein
MTASLVGVTINFRSLIDYGFVAPPEIGEYLDRQHFRNAQKPKYLARRRHAHADVEVPVRDSGTSQGDSHE